MALENLNRGDKVDIHVFLYAADAAILDDLCKRHGASRAAVIGELLREQRANETRKDPNP